MFVVLLLVSAAMVSLPTGEEPGERIVAFYTAHGQLIVIQQVVGVAALGAFVAFALSLRRNRWLRPALWFFVVAELTTNAVPLLIVVSRPSPDTAHAMTVIEEFADSALFIAIAVFVAAATLRERTWLRIAAYVVAAASVLRAVGGPLGFTALDAVAPLVFVAFVLVLSGKLLIESRSAAAAEPAS